MSVPQARRRVLEPGGRLGHGLDAVHLSGPYLHSVLDRKYVVGIVLLADGIVQFGTLWLHCRIPVDLVDGGIGGSHPQCINGIKALVASDRNSQERRWFGTIWWLLGLQLLIIVLQPGGLGAFGGNGQTASLQIGSFLVQDAVVRRKLVPNGQEIGYHTEQQQDAIAAATGFPFE